MQRPVHRNANAPAGTRSGSTEFRPAGLELRCGCHRLVARAVPDGIEMRCPRCKTDVVLSWSRVHELEAEARLLRAR